MVKSIRQMGALMQKEFLLEWRQRYALNGMVLYIVGAVFVCYLSFNARRGQLTPIVWNTLFWPSAILLLARRTRLFGR